jgi:sigma-B regulation protein RsbU (phosphoserine phosphatase)
MFGIRDAAVDASNTIGGQAAQVGGDALIEQALTDTAVLAAAQARSMNLKLENAASTLELLAAQLTHIYQNPDDYSLVPFEHCRFNTGEKREMQWMLSPSMTGITTGREQDLVQAGVLDETFLIGNMQTLFEQVMTQYPNISCIYTTSYSGVNTAYDDKSPTKITDDVSTDVAQLRTRGWYYTVARDLEPKITDTYQDRFGRGLCITFSAPYYGIDGGFMGVIGMDFLIRDLSENVLQATVGETGYAVLLNVHENAAAIIAAPHLDQANEDDVGFYLGENWRSVLDKIRNADTGVAQSVISDVDCPDIYVIWAPVKMTGWTFLYVLPKDEITAPSELIRSVIGEMTQDVISETTERIVTTIVILFGLTLAVLFGTSFMAARVSKRITNPIRSLAGDVKVIGEGNLQYTSNIKTGDEIEELSLSFQSMTVALKEYIENLANVTAEKERIGAELDVAKQIQASMLPCIFPAFPDREEFDIYASMLPAKEVGGDFYDFFLIDRNTLAVVMADVSGKGVPAALFMVIAKTLIKNNAQYGKSPKEVFETVNNLLCENNEADMFVTTFMGYLDIPTGRFTYVNAGHNFPLIKPAGEDFVWLKEKPGFVLAGMEDMFYKQHEIMLKPGDELFLYTDGITEAVNNDNDLFSDEKLLETANNYRDLPLKEFTVSIKREIDKFAGGAEQADDITMLALRVIT